MRRMLMILSMAAMLGIGLFLGSALTPEGNAQVTGMTRPDGYSGGSPYNYAAGYAIIPPRWQVFPVVSPDRSSIVILLDSTTGDAFYLRGRDGVYYWSRITR